MGVLPAKLAGFRAPTIIVHEGEDEDQIIKDMEARGEIPPLENFPAGCIRVIVHRVVDPPNLAARALSASASAHLIARDARPIGVRSRIRKHPR